MNTASASGDYRWRTPGDWVEEANKRYLAQQGRSAMAGHHMFYPKIASLENNHLESGQGLLQDVPPRDAFVMFGQRAQFSQEILNQPMAGGRLVQNARNILFTALQPLPYKRLGGKNQTSVLSADQIPTELDHCRAQGHGNGKLFWWLG